MKLSKEELLAGARSVAGGYSSYDGMASGDLVITVPCDGGGWKAEWMFTNDKDERKVATTLTMTDSDVVLRALILTAFNE